MTIAVIADFYIQEEFIDKAKQILVSIIEPSKNDEGCISYDLYQSPENSEHFKMVEQWQSHDLWQAHMQADFLSSAKDHLLPLLTREIEVHWYQQIECVN